VREKFAAKAAAAAEIKKGTEQARVIYMNYILSPVGFRWLEKIF
jgi:hypothetical protein